MGQYLDRPTDNPSISVHITWPVSRDPAKPITVRAYAIDTTTGIRLDGAKIHKCTAKSAADLDSARQRVYARVQQALAHRAHKASASQPAQPSDAPMMRAYAQLQDTCDPISSTWGTRTRNNHMTYFARNVLPVLSAHDDVWSAADTEALRQSLIAGVLATRRGSGISTTVTASVDVHLVASDKIYQRMCAIDPALSPLSLIPAATGKRAKAEPCKSLPHHVRQALTRKISALVDSQPRLAMAAIAMYDCGLRTAEAAAVWTDVILHLDNVTCIYVGYQMRDDVRSDILKSANSYRTVPMSTWGRTMLMRCLGNLPDTNPEHFAICAAAQLSTALRTMLIDCGLTDDYLQGVVAAMQQHPDYVDGTASTDIQAYILRHDFSSRARNICGLTSVEIDCLLGHDIPLPQSLRDDLRQSSKLEDIARRLERYVYDPTCSSHPGCVPYAIGHGIDLDLTPYDKIHLRNESAEPVQVKLDVTAALSAEPITIIAPQGSCTSITQRQIPTRCVRNAAPVIGSSRLLEEGDQ